MEFKVLANQSGMSVNDFLRKEKNFSRRIICSIKFQDGILVNNMPVWTNYKLKENDIISIVFSEKTSDNTIAEDIPIDIIYQDDYLLAVNKPADMPAHPSFGHGSGTLANAVTGYYNNNGIKTAVRILGRLDKNTSGLVIISKNQLVHKLLSERYINKFYTAIVQGKPKNGRIDAPIEDLHEGIRRIVSPNGKPSVTLYKTIEEKGDFALIELQLLTGRTHQIRVHMSHIGYPLIGDELYGGKMLMDRQALHASRMEFTHPITGEEIKITAPLPYDMDNFWRSI